jgi:hypothetical protein
MFANVNTVTNANTIMNNNSLIRTPVSSSPISSFRLQTNDNVAAHLSTPQLLSSFQGTETRPDSQQENSQNQNDINLIIDIPDNIPDNNDNIDANVDDETDKNPNGSGYSPQLM